jgi:hypothetical protein
LARQQTQQTTDRHIRRWQEPNCAG